jgi:alpha-L-fucosidase
MRLIIIALLFLVSCKSKTTQYSVVETHLLENAENAPSAHASSIVEVGDGEILATWFSGEHEGHEQVGISLSRYKNNQWEPAKKVASAETIDGVTYPCWNPVLVKNTDNKLLLFYKVGPNPREWWGKMITSTDNGETWSESEKLPDGFMGPIRVKSIVKPNSDLLHPSSYETPKEDYWTMHFEVSDKDGKNWRKVEVDNDTFQVIQPTVLHLADGKLLSLARSRHNKVIASVSDNYGDTWGNLYPINLPNPNSGIDAINLTDDKFLMVYNPLTAGKNWWEGRNVILLGESTDGENWKEVIKLEDHEKGEFSYPAIIKTSDGKIHIHSTENKLSIW